MKIVCILIFLCCFSPFILQAQSSTASTANQGAMEAGIAIGTLATNNFKVSELVYDDIKGSPYVEKDYLIGHVVLIDNKKSNEIRLQYDIYTNEFFFINDDDKELVIDLKLVREVVMVGKEEAYLFKRINPALPHKFYEIIYESESIDIYNEMDINFREGRDQGVVKIEPSFSRDDQYYVMSENKKPKKIKLKKKDVLKLFSKEEQKKIDSILKEQKNKLKKSKDFKRLFEAMEG